VAEIDGQKTTGGTQSDGNRRAENDGGKHRAENDGGGKQRVEIDRRKSMGGNKKRGGTRRVSCLLKLVLSSVCVCVSNRPDVCFCD